jgi:DNA helicase-2/ATP-dependent DNA helicase PcrA
MNIQNFYNEITTLKKSLIPNESKANELRKMFEKLLMSELNIDLNENRQLMELINEYVITKNRSDIQHISHSLRKKLNPWSHANDYTLDDTEVEDYFNIFRNIVFEITGKADEKRNIAVQKFQLKDLMLNKKQEEAVLSPAKITLVNAGPGTGKTYLVVGRVLHELSQNPNKKIFCLSFTNKAAEELQERIENKIYSTDLVTYKNNISTGTIHSFALQMIQKYYEFNDKLFDFIVIDEQEYNEIKDDFEHNTEKIEAYLIENKMLTFDKIISLFINTMKKNENFKNFVRNKLDEIIIDEAQDLNKLQYEILYLLYENKKELKLFFVGDQRQNIYAFTGGSLNNILEFFKGETDFKLIELEHSYRCPSSILTFVNRLQFDDCKNIELHNAIGNKGQLHHLKSYEDKEDEGIAIAKLIKDKQKAGISLNDIAIIHTSSFYFKDILEALNAYEISFKVFGGQYFLNEHIKFIRALLNYIYTQNSHALKNVQTYFIGRDLQGKNIDEILIPLSDMDTTQKPKYRNLKITLQFIKIQMQEVKTPLDILNNYIELCTNKLLVEEEAIELFYGLKQIIENDLTLNNFDKLKLAFTPHHPKFSQFYSRSDQIVPCEFEDDKNHVAVTTVHAAKGLEWNHIIIPGMSQDTFPRYFKTQEIRKKELPNEIKKFYVACTRSRNHLHFTRSKTNDWGYRKESSEFIKGIE